MFRRCTVFGCQKSEKEEKLFAIPQDCDEEWLEVVKFRKPLKWVPKKSTKICALHFKKSDIVGYFAPPPEHVKLVLFGFPSSALQTKPCRYYSHSESLR